MKRISVKESRRNSVKCGRKVCVKNGVHALRVPMYDLVSNWAYMVIAALAWNIKSWFALMMHRIKHRRHYIRVDFRTFLNHIILFPCRVVTHAKHHRAHHRLSAVPEQTPKRLDHHRTHRLHLTPTRTVTVDHHSIGVLKHARDPYAQITNNRALYPATSPSTDLCTTSRHHHLAGTIALINPNAPKCALRLNKQQYSLVLGLDGRVNLYEMPTGEMIAIFDRHNHGVKSVVFLPDGKTLASGSQDGTILLWDLQRLHSVPHVLKGVSGIEQKGPAGTVLAQPFVVTVRDESGEPYAGATVTFVVTAGGGTLSVTTDTTDAGGNAATTLTSGTQPGINTVVATVAELEPVTFTAIGQANPDFNGNGIVGFGDFLQFAERFGLGKDDDGYEARYDLDGNGVVGFSDFLIFAGEFGKTTGNLAI